MILALLCQYILVGLMLSRLVRPDIAVLKIMIGAFICPILFLSARQLPVRASLLSPVGEKQPPVSTTSGVIFRLLAALLILLVTLTIGDMFILTGLSLSITITIYWLILMGLIILVIAEQPLKTGIGLLTILTGFDLLYTMLERSLLMTGLWGAANLLIALAISYLIVARGANPKERT